MPNRPIQPQIGEPALFLDSNKFMNLFSSILYFSQVVTFQASLHLQRLGVRSSVENILCRLPNVPTELWLLRNMSHGSVKLLISEEENKPKFETYEVDPPKKHKWLTKKRLKIQRKKEKQQRKAANKRDPRRLGIKGKKKTHKFANA